MRWEDCLRLAVALCAVSVCLAIGFSPSGVSEEPAKPKPVEMVFPPNRAVLVEGDFDVICKAQRGDLKVEGESFDWEPFKPPVRVAHVNLYPGRNQFRIGSDQLEVYVARKADEPGKPKGWDVYRKHPISGHGAKRCAACHETKQEGEHTGVGELKSHKACFECHPGVEFEVVHSHPLEPIEHCQMCHGLHASKEEALLKAPVKELCADCHDS